jgi:hypothetical protein
VARSRLTAILVGGLLLAAAIAGCGGSSGSSGSKSAGGFTLSGLRQASYNPASHAARSSGYKRKVPQRVSRRAAAGFLRHAALAFGIFHRQVYEPYKSGQLNFRHQKLIWARAEAATSVTLREVTAAKEASQREAALRVLFFPLGALQVTLLNLEKQLKRGRTDAMDIRSANSTILSIDAAASRSGLRIVDAIPAVAVTPSSTPGSAKPSHTRSAEPSHPRRAMPSHKRGAKPSHQQGARPSHKRSATP